MVTATIREENAEFCVTVGPVTRTVGTLTYLIISSVRHSVVGCRTFPVAGACMCNNLPSHITSPPSLLTFKQRLKMHFSVAPTSVLLFNCSFPLWSLK